MSETTRWEAMENPAARTKGDPKYQVREPDGWPVALVWRERDLSLVAAAPGLLDACRRAIDEIYQRGVGCGCPPRGPGCVVCALEMAIAKATGR